MFKVDSYITIILVKIIIEANAVLDLSDSVYLISNKKDLMNLNDKDVGLCY